MKKIRLTAYGLVFMSFLFLIVCAIFFKGTMPFAFGIFLGVWLGSARAIFEGRYNGDLEISTRVDGVKDYLLNIDGNPEDWAKMDDISLKVVLKGLKEAEDG